MAEIETLRWDPTNDASVNEAEKAFDRLKQEGMEFFQVETQEVKDVIDSERIETILKDCLYRDEEIGGAGIPEDAVRTKGIVTDYGFHPQRLESHRDEIKAMLLELPDPFMRSKGGGWSFLNACLDRQGNQWTGLHQRMEQLFMLGEGLGLVTCIVPRALWPALPGGMPYYMVLDEVSPAADLTAKGMATDSER